MTRCQQCGSEMNYGNLSIMISLQYTEKINAHIGCKTSEIKPSDKVLAKSGKPKLHWLKYEVFSNRQYSLASGNEDFKGHSVVMLIG